MSTHLAQREAGNVFPLSPSDRISERVNALIPKSIADALSLAEIMAKASLIPEHLKNKPGDCLLVVMQAQRWGMDASSVAQCTAVVRGKMCYEGKLVAAALYSMGVLEGRLKYEFSGSGDQRSVRVTGRLRGQDYDQTVEGCVRDWKTDNGNWLKSPDDMLVYRGTRQWARRYAPEVLLGVYTPDELEEAPPTAVESGRIPHVIEGRAGKAEYDDELFKKNLAQWRKVIENGRSTADEIIAMASTRGELSDEQKAELRAITRVDQATGEVLP